MDWKQWAKYYWILIRLDAFSFGAYFYTHKMLYRVKCDSTYHSNWWIFIVNSHGFKWSKQYLSGHSIECPFWWRVLVGKSLWLWGT